MEFIVKRIRPSTVFALCCSTLGFVAHAHAESARYIDLQGFSRLLEGDAVSTSLSEDGAIGLSLTSQDRYVSAAAQIGVSCLYKDEVVTVQPGKTPKLVAIDSKGHERIFGPDLTGRLVTRMAVHTGALVLALAPKPELVLLHPSGKSQTIAVPDVGFVWDMLSAPDGSLLVATGEPGRILKLNANGAWQTVFEAEEAHIKNLAYDARVGLVAGGGQRGIVYHGGLNGNMRALYDSGNTEVTALAIEGNAIFVASVTGAQAAIAAPAEAGVPGGKGAQDVQSRVVSLGLDGTSELLAGSNDEIIFDLISERPGSVLLATGAVPRKDARGRLYRLNTARRSIALLHQSASKRLVRLLPHPSGELLAVGQDGSRITSFTKQPRTTGTYVTPAFDTGINSTFGTVQALGDFPRGSSGTLSVRTGQTSEPDGSWAPWSKETDAAQAQVSGVPPGRYAQVRLLLRGTAAAQPEVLRLRLSYLRQNLAPFIRDLSPMEKGLALAALPSTQSQDEARTKIVVLGDRSDDAAADAARKPAARARQTQERGALTIRWLVDDANGDELESTLWMRPLHDESWKLLASGLSDTFYSLQSTQLADGYYLFKVRVSDVRSNPTGLARQDERVSRAVLVDNTPPVFERLKVQVKNRRAKLTGQVSDTAGLLTSLQVAVDGGPLRPWMPQDGVLDGPIERLDGDLGMFVGGAHTLTLVAQDEAQNEAFATVRFDVPQGS